MISHKPVAGGIYMSDNNNFNLVNCQEQNSFSSKEFEKFKEHKLKSETLNLAKRYEKTPLKSKRCAICGNWFKFDEYVNKETGEVKKKLTDARFCQVRFCPMCAWLNARDLANEMRSVCTQIEESQKVSYLFLTLTVKNPPLTELRSTIQMMSKAFNKLSKSKPFDKAIKGYIRSIEFLGDFTTPGFAHPHIHALLVVKPHYFKTSYYITQDQWSTLWQSSLKVDYTPVVDVRRIKAKNSNWLDSDSAIFETIKYCAKPLSVKKLSQEHFEILDKQTKNIRQYNKGGLFKTIKPRPNDDEFSSEIWELIEKSFFRWNGKDYERY